MVKTKLIESYPFISYSKKTYKTDKMTQRTVNFYNEMEKRRTVRDFSDKPVPKQVIENINQPHYNIDYLIYA